MVGVLARLAREPAARLARRSLMAGAALLGYVLSPLSWWNDAFVNIPLSLAAAALLERLTGLDPRAGFALAYWASNVAGLALMLLGGEGAARGRVSRRSLLASLAAGTAYTLAVVLAMDAFM